jgi:hypothetical protein
LWFGRRDASPPEIGVPDDHIAAGIDKAPVGFRRKTDQIQLRLRDHTCDMKFSTVRITH